MRREFRNKPTHIVINGQDYDFKSKFEANWALYLSFLQDTEVIKDWDYEQVKFNFVGETTAPVQYTPDFRILDKDGNTYFQECKGYFEGKDNSRFRRLIKYNPGVVIDLVLQQKPSRGKKARQIEITQKYCRRIIYASDIFKQIKGYVKLI
jgi:hypothetical protein